jgi:hypothetical protein
VEINKCQGVMIYTNNTGPKEWIHHIKDFFEEKIKYKLFNHVICAFKVNGKQIEMCRTTYEKTVKDFIKCTKLPENTQICFLDDLFHPKMNYENVYYIKLKAYTYDLTASEILNRFVNSGICKHLIPGAGDEEQQYFNEFMMANLNNYTYISKSKQEYEIDKIITKQTMLYLQHFFHAKQMDQMGTTATIENGLQQMKKTKMFKSQKTNKNYKNKTQKRGQ